MGKSFVSLCFLYEWEAQVVLCWFRQGVWVVGSDPQLGCCGVPTAPVQFFEEVFSFSFAYFFLRFFLGWLQFGVFYFFGVPLVDRVTCLLALSYYAFCYSFSILFGTYSLQFLYIITLPLKKTYVSRKMLLRNSEYFLKTMSSQKKTGRKIPFFLYCKHFKNHIDFENIIFEVNLILLLLFERKKNTFIQVIIILQACYGDQVRILI